MTRRSLITAAVALGALATVGVARAEAQITEISRSRVSDMSRVTFGHWCDDKFVLRNEGDALVRAELAVAKSGEHTPVTLGAREQIQFNSPSRQDVELWVDGALVATAKKERRSCRNVAGSASVEVNAPEVTTREPERRYYAPYPAVDPWFYGAGAYWGLGYYGGYWGPRGSTIIVRQPVVVRGRGGVPRGGRRR